MMNSIQSLPHSENNYAAFIIRHVKPFCSKVVGTPYILLIQSTQLALRKYMHTEIHTFEDGLNSGILVDMITLETTSGDKS